MSHIGHIAAQIVADIRFCRKVEQLHQRGPRAVLEVLAEISAERSIGTIVEKIVNRHLDVPDQALEAIGGNQLTPSPLHAINDADESGDTAA